MTGLPGLGTYGYNDANHVHAVTHISGTQKYWYDANGNMTTRTMTETFYLTYDAENRLVEASTVQSSAYEDWDYKKPVTLSYSGSTLTDYDVLIEMDTATLITAGKMDEDCNDLRVTDSDGETQLDYWIEGGCDTSSTQIWAQVPSIPDGGKTLYVYYGNASATNEEESWSGNFIMLYDGSCPTGWNAVSALNNYRFPVGSTSYGTTGGSATHNHGDASCTTGTAAGSVKTRIGSGGFDLDLAHPHGCQGGCGRQYKRLAALQGDGLLPEP